MLKRRSLHVEVMIPASIAKIPFNFMFSVFGIPIQLANRSKRVVINGPDASSCSGTTWRLHPY